MLTSALASAELIVSGGLDLLALTAYKRILIVTPAAALPELQALT